MPFTPEGVQARQNEISNLSVDERLEISLYAANNPIDFISENFELSEEQQEYLRSLELVDLRVTGFSIAAGLLGQIPIEMQDTTPPSAFAARGKKKKEVSASINTSTNPQTGATTLGGSIIVKWTW